MPPFAVIECFDVRDDGTRGLFAGGIMAAVYLSTFSECQKLSIGALSKQLPLLLIDCTMP